MKKNDEGKVIALVGGQYGSEGKGVIAAHIANLFNIHVRTGGPNAGHTFHHNGGLHVMQSVPCGWINPTATLILGIGGLVEIDQLVKEIDMLFEIDPDICGRIVIDTLCGVISPHHKQEEGGVDGAMHERIGSTGKGVGTARRDRVMRDPGSFFFMEDYADVGSAKGYGWRIEDMLYNNTPALIETRRRLGTNVLLEGTQGSGLSLIHGSWPYVTSQDTNAGQLCTDAGIAPTRLHGTILVCRTYPIRVAGNSGPLYKETTWKNISERTGREMEERTTVTKKIRRVGQWDEELVEKAVYLNNPSYLAITFMDYLSPEDEGVEDYTQLSPRALGFIEYLETQYNTRVGFVSTGGETLNVVNLYDNPGGILK